MALSTYTNLNATNDAVSMTAIDSGVYSAPTDRLPTFTPVGGYVSVPVASDYGVGTVAAVRARCFEPPSITASITRHLPASAM